MEMKLNCTKFGLNCVVPFHLHNSIIRFYCVITVLTRVPREKKTESPFICYFATNIWIVMQ